MLKHGYKSGSLLSLFFLHCHTTHLDTNLIETRQSAVLNSLLQKFQPCQTTLLAMHSSNIHFFSGNTQPIEIFVLPFPYTEDKLLKILTVEQNSVYSIIFGLKYTQKFWVPVCKFNAILSSTQDVVDPFRLVFSLLKYSGFNIAGNNNRLFRSVYCQSKMFNLILFKKRNPSDSISRILVDLSKPEFRVFKFCTLSLMPLNKEFLNPIIWIQLGFTAFYAKRKHRANLYYSDVLVDEFTCQTNKGHYFCKSK